MELIKLLIVFAVIIIALRLKAKLFLAVLASIIATILLWQINIPIALQLWWNATKSWNTISMMLILYFITFLQRMLERRSQLKKAQQDLNGIFNNRRVNATLAPVFIGLLPSAAAAILCGDIVSDACGDDLSTDEKAFVTTYFRHIPESFLPTYSAVILMSGLAEVSIGAFVLGMLPLEIALFALGYFFYVRKIPRETGVAPSDHKWKDALGLLKHLWSLLAIILLILAFKLPVVAAIGLITVAAIFVYRFKPAELAPMVKSAFEPVLISNIYLIMIFKEVITHTGVINTLPETLSVLPIPTFLIFALIFFFGAVISGSSAIIAIGTPLAFSAIPGGGMPLMVLLMSFCYAAMQISPTHVCLTVVAEYFHTSLGGIVKKTLPVIGCFCVIATGYYLLLTLVF